MSTRSLMIILTPCLFCVRYGCTAVVEPFAGVEHAFSRSWISVAPPAISSRTCSACDKPDMSSVGDRIDFGQVEAGVCLSFN